MEHKNKKAQARNYIILYNYNNTQENTSISCVGSLNYTRIQYFCSTQSFN